VSVPARSLPLPAPAPRPRRPAAPAPARTPGARTKATARPARRGLRHPTFLLFAAVVVSVMVMGLVALNALLVQTTYRMQTIRQEVSDLSDQQVQLTDQVARKSSPETVAKWARLHGMTTPLPGDTVILPVPGVTSAPDANAGAGG
jgi:cell division protein FtsL